MDLKNFLSSKSEESQEFYWALVVEPEWVQAGIWEIREETAQVISFSPPTAWGSQEELVSAIDTVLSAAVQALPEDVKEPSKTVFGVSSTWVTGGQIKPEYLELLKKICSDLSLNPTGFVVLSEAIAHLIKSEEGSPLSGITVGVGSESIEISLFKLGNLIATTSVSRSVSIVDDLSEGLTRFATGESFPSRILLYDGKEGELEETKQILLKANWDDFEKINFLHVPKIEIINPKRKIIAVSLAGAAEIADISSVETKQTLVETEPVVSETPVKPVKVEDVGFVVGQDVASIKEEKVEHVEHKEKKEIPEKKVRSKFLKKDLFFGILSKIKNMKKPNLSGMGSRKTFVLGGAILALILLTGFILWWYLPKATVTIYVSPKKLDEKVTIFINPTASKPDFGKAILPGEFLKTLVSGEKTKATTGTKTVGEKAKGTIEIRNGRVEAIRLPAGTKIFASNNLEFSLDSTASVSGKLDPETPGKKEVKVTAVNIGAEYNLAKSERFRVGSYSKAEVDAIAISDFSGGSSRQIAAVSADDQETLLADLEEELIDKAKKELAQITSSEQLFIEESVVATASSKNFSNKVGDEASNLKLSLSLEVASVVVNKTALSDFAKEILKEAVPTGFVLREDQIDVRFDFEGEKDGLYELTAYFDVNLLPKTDPEEIAREISGKYKPVAQDYLTTIPGFTRAEINIKPSLPGRLKTLPHLTKNIEVELAAER
jgi:hypothetical protein